MTPPALPHQSVVVEVEAEVEAAAEVEAVGSAYLDRTLDSTFLDTAKTKITRK